MSEKKVTLRLREDQCDLIVCSIEHMIDRLGDENMASPSNVVAGRYFKRRAREVIKVINYAIKPAEQVTP